MSDWIGIDLGGTNTKFVRVGEDASLGARASIRTLAPEGPDRWIERAAEQLDGWLADAPRGIGLSVAGLVRPDGRLEHAPNLRGFERYDFRAAFAARWPGLAVHVENDVNAALFGEHAVGVARGTRFATMLSLGTGVGGGFVVEGRLYRGADGMGAEFGHLVLDHDGPLCKCGIPGHVESYLSAEAIANFAAARCEADPRGEALLAAARQAGAMSPRILGEAAAEGDALAIEILADRGYYLGLACANVAHLANPEICVIGGGVAQAGRHLLEPARRTLRERAMATPATTMRVELAHLGPDGAAIGAALLASKS